MSEQPQDVQNGSHTGLILSDRARDMLDGLRRYAMTYTWPQVPWGTLAEIGAIVLWAVWVGRAYLDLTPNQWPTGLEFGMAIHSHYVWTLLSECGLCVLWNGFVSGGMPAFVETHGVVLHPLVIVTTLGWGVINGVKIALIASLAMGGLAQWWLAKVLRLGLVPRLWSAGMAVVAGHIAGKMEVGLFPLVLSTAAASLVIAAGLDLALNRRPRTIVWFGLTLALALVSGQGYLQIGLLLGLVPAYMIFFVDDHLRIDPIWKSFFLGGLLAILLASIYLVPLVHFLPFFAKDIDSSFGSAQSLVYAPLNLVISDMDFYRTDILGKDPFPYQYLTYIGWIPVLFAILGLRIKRNLDWRVIPFLLISVFLIYSISSATLLRILVIPFPEFISGIRYPAIISGLVVPLILGTSALGLDCLLNIRWPSIMVGIFTERENSLRFDSRYLILSVLLLCSIKSGYDFSSQFLVTATLAESHYDVIEATKTESAQWISPPYGEHWWTPIALESGLKTTRPVRPWRWADRSPPEPFIEANRKPDLPEGASPLQVIDNINLYVFPDHEYAFVDTGTDKIPCRATAKGGHIDVDCDTDVSGTLWVMENHYSGWSARRDNVPIPLGGGQWLNVHAPAGASQYQFRYRPLDVAVGFMLTLSGVVLAIWLWFRPLRSWDD
jgi:hypothetical protein